MPNDCQYCEEPRLNFVDEYGGVEMWIADIAAYIGLPPREVDAE